MPNKSQSIAIPNPEPDLESHQATLMALKEAVEVLLHQRTSAGGASTSGAVPRSVSGYGQLDRTQLLLNAYQPDLPGIITP